MVRYMAQYCTSTTPVESSVALETAAVAETTTTSIEYYTTGRETPSKKSWYCNCATTTHVCGDLQKFKLSTEYTNREEREICNFNGRVAHEDIGHGDVHLRLRLPRGCHSIWKVFARNAFHLEGAYNSLSQSQLMDRVFQIGPVTG